MDRPRMDGLLIVSLGLLVMMGLNVLSDAGSSTSVSPVSAAEAAPPATQVASLGVSTLVNQPLPDGPDNAQAAAFGQPYDSYILTQGLHGFSYGHMAIDISAGKGASIKSPIQGVVTELYIDQWGNTTLVIENEVYRVTFMHGLYTVKIGDALAMGQAIGTESNQGYTLDAAGRSCAGRDCGYHSHLNVFDKRIGANVSPLELLGL